LFVSSNHLGNNMVVISDKKIGVDVAPADGIIDYYNADVISAQDYYPFGMIMPGRKYSSSSSKYRYGFNGKENDNEIKGEGNQIDYGMRVYDPRIAKFLSVDPLQADYPELTPYQFSGNNPIENVDLDGKEVYDFRLDLDDKGHTTGFSYVGENTHGIGGWSIWNVLNVHIPGVDVYRNGNFIGRYTFNTESQGGFKTLTQFATDETFRNTYMGTNQTVEQANHKIAEDVGNTFKDGIAQAAVVGYAQSRVQSKPQSPSNASKTATKTEEKTKSANGGTAASGAKKSATTGAATTAGNQAKPVVSGNAGAYSFVRTETPSGNKSARAVGANIKILNEGGSLAPIEVASINNKLYIINGHHRVEAAIRTNTSLNYTILTEQQWKAYGYKSESEVVGAAAEASATKVKLDNKVVQKAATQSP
jgi:RHS repeat-associated protein